MNDFRSRAARHRFLFIMTLLLLFAAFSTGCCSLLPTAPSAVSGSDVSGSDSVSGADVLSGSDASAVSETDVVPLTPEELKTFWDESVFVGDSVTLGLRNYAVRQRNNGVECLSGAQFLAMGSMSYANTLPPIGSGDSIHPKFQGKPVTIEEGVRLTGAKNVFIMLGMNDFYGYSIEIGLESAQEVVARIKNVCPDTNIYIESVTPTLYDRRAFNNANIDIFNEKMRQLCEEKGWTFVNVASVMKDENNKFKREYCSDPEDIGVHMDAEGCVAWVDYLNDFITNGGKTK